MKKIVRKWIATALAVALLVSVLPLSGLMTVFAASMPVTANLVTNGDFEVVKSGNATYWHGGSYSAEAAYAGSYGMQATGTAKLYQTIAVDQGCSYLLTFYAKLVSGENFTVRVNGGNVYLQETCTNADWSLYTFLVNVSAADEQAQLAFFGASADTVVYLDNVILVLSGAAETTVLKNGGFETGNASGWSLNTGTVVTAEVTHSGEYAIKTVNTNEKYEAIGRQYFDVEPGADYTLTFWYYYVGTNAEPSFYTYSIGTSDKANIKTVTTYAPAANTWYMVTLSFNAGTYDNVYVNLQNRTADDGGVYYFDDFEAIKDGDTSGDETAEATNLITNSTFETGAVTGWSSATTSSNYKVAINASDAHTGNYSATISARNKTLTAYQDVTVEENTDYIVSCYYKSTNASAGFDMVLGAFATSATTTSGTALSTPVALSCANTEWVLATYYFNSGSNTAVRIGFGCNAYSSLSNFMYVDDVYMVKQFTSFPEESIKGTYYSSSKAYETIVPEQTFAVQAGKTYTLSFSARAMTNGFRLYVNGASGNDLFWSEDARSWTDVTYTFRSTADSLTLKVVNLGNGTLETNLYITDFVVEEIPDEEVDLFSFKGTSAREQAPEPHNITAGLGFLFRVDMQNAVTAKESDGNIYQANSATAYPFISSLYPDDPYAYTVVRVGAVMSLDAAVAEEGLTLEDATNAKTIDIPGRKRWVYGDTDMDNGYSYAVRIINIPESGFSTTIYARPYVIVKAGEQEIVLYGEMQSATYDQHFE